MKSQRQDGGKKRQRQRQQQIKILYRVTRRIVCEMTYRDYDTLRLLSKTTEECASFFRCLETGQRPVNDIYFSKQKIYKSFCARLAHSPGGKSTYLQGLLESTKENLG